jgi:23S rRNA (uracil1939-C5)-methyltransferase
MLKITEKCRYFPACGGCDFIDLDDHQYQKTKKNLLNKFSFSEKINWIFFDIYQQKSKRRKISLQINSFNQVGFFEKKTKKIIPINSCFVADQRISNLITEANSLLAKLPTKIFSQITLIAFDNAVEMIFKSSKKISLTFNQNSKLADFAAKNNLNLSIISDNYYENIYIWQKSYFLLGEKKIFLAGDIFIQATVSGLDSIAAIIRNFIKENKAIKKIADIYSGFGVYSFVNSDLVDSISCFEGNEEMAKINQENIIQNQLNHKIKSYIRDLFFSPINHLEINKFDLVIINPPRNGATPQISEIAKSKLKNVIYISCNPDSFNSNFLILEKSGFVLKNIFAIDQFYATRHIELAAIFTRN